MIELLDLENVTSNMVPVTSSEYIMGKSQQFHPDGLFSEVIFGSIDSVERRKTFSFIDLNCKVLHPALNSIIKRLNSKILSVISKEDSYKINENGELEKDPEGGITGITSLIDNFNKINLQSNDNKFRDDLIKMVESYRKKDMVFISKLIVIPAYYREAEMDPIKGTMRVDPMNDYYVKILRQSIQLQSLKGGEVFDVIASKMNDLVLDLYDYITAKIGKKSGLIREKVLGKIADFTARAVITGGSDKIRVNEIGVPFKVLVKLFEPFILHDLLYSNNVTQSQLTSLLREHNNTTMSIPTLRNLLSGIYQGDELPVELENLIKASVTRVIKDKVVLAKRDPALHTESVQGFYPIMVDGSAIQLNPLKCAGFGADFDGDQMAIYVPITTEAIQEAKDKLISSEATNSMLNLSDDFSKDFIIGSYGLTRDANLKKSIIVIKKDSDIDSLDVRQPVRYGSIDTTVGRIIFNRIMPDKYPFINEPVTKKKVAALALNIYNKYDKDVYVQWCQDFVSIGSKYFTILATSFSLDDLTIPLHIYQLKEQLKQSKSSEESDRIIKTMEKSLEEHLVKSGSNLGVIGEAGGLKEGYSQVRQILVAKGLIADNSGNLMKPISDSYSDGLSSKEFFHSGIGSRRGIVDRVINTAETGYMSRQLVSALQRVEADPAIKDCKTKRTLRLRVSSDMIKRLHGRFILDDIGRIEPIGDPQDKLDQVIQLRSPIYCTSDRICYTCYGEMLYRNKTHYVGILAGHVLGEPLSQTIMKSFHQGGSVKMRDVDAVNEFTNVLKKDEASEVKQIIYQKHADVYSKLSGSIIITFSDYLHYKKDVIFKDNFIEFKYGYFKLKYDKIEIDITLDTKVKILLSDKNMVTKDDHVIINFPDNSLIMSVPPVAEAFSEQVKVIKSLLNGKQPWKSPDHLLMKIYDVYHNIARADLVHLEILASNLLRDKGNPSFPARLNKNYSAVVGNLKNIPALESWLQSLNFENINKSITQGLVYDRPKQETLLERIVSGNL